MKSTIKIPNKIKVGFQNRDGTYTGKLAYIIYYDEKGKIRKEASWNSWRNEEIEALELTNDPLEGFVLNKKAGGYSTGWNHRQTYVRVYDPRGFEFEVDVPNLLYILENTNSIKGKGLEGKFIYGWDGKDLVLLPTESPDYVELKQYNDLVKKNKSFKGKDMITGATYLTKKNREVIYMGRFDSHGYNKTRKEYFFYNRKAEAEWNWVNGKRIVTKFGRFESYVALGKNIIDVISELCVEDCAEIFDKLEYDENYNPYDPSKDEYHYHTLESFTRYIMNNKPDKTRCYSNYSFIYYCKDNKMETKHSGFDCKFYYDENKFIWSEFENIKDERSWYRNNRKYVEREVTIEEFFNQNKPQWKKEYLKDGKLRRILYYE